MLLPLWGFQKDMFMVRGFGLLGFGLPILSHARLIYVAVAIPKSPKSSRVRRRTILTDHMQLQGSGRLWDWQKWIQTLNQNLGKPKSSVATLTWKVALV